MASRVRILALAACLSLAACIAPTRDPARIVRGPIPVRENAPLPGQFLAFRPRRAATLEDGRTELGLGEEYSSIFQNGRGPDSHVVLDGELSRTSLTVRRGVGGRTDVEVELAVVDATSGFLDRLIETWHDTLGLPNSGREKRPRFAYEMRVEKNGDTIYSLAPDEPSLADVPIFVTHAVQTETDDDPGIAIRAGIELPLGSESRGVGNGGLDAGVGAIVEKSIDRWTLTGGAEWIVTTTPDGFARQHVDALDPLRAWGSAELRWNDRSSLVAGLRWTMPVTRDVGIREVGGDSLEADGAIAIDCGASSRVLFGLSDDLLSTSGPDFTVFAEWTIAL